MAKKQKFYVVWEGNTPGIYTSWGACQAQIKGYPNAKYKAYKTQAEAQAAYNGNYWDEVKSGLSTKNKPTISTISEAARKEIVWDSISVDAACSGNPGVTEYQGVDTKTKAQIFHLKLDLGTNNIGEFLALVHALAMFKKAGKNTPIYTDSKTAMAWVRNKKVKTTFPKNAKTLYVHQLLERAITWLKNNTYNNPILKWKTEEWGEIPADFGRK